jgi:hypothetical protein
VQSEALPSAEATPQARFGVRGRLAQLPGALCS